MFVNGRFYPTAPRFVSPPLKGKHVFEIPIIKPGDSLEGVPPHAFIQAKRLPKGSFTLSHKEIEYKYYTDPIA